MVEIPDGGWVSRLIDELPDTCLPPQLREGADLSPSLAQLPGPGWMPILDRLHTALIEIDPDYSDRFWKLTLCDGCAVTEPGGRPAPAGW